jgi:hypothetical protein
MSERAGIAGAVVEYASAAPGWRGVWPARGDRGVVLAHDGERVLVRWRVLRGASERDVWTHIESVRQIGTHS